MLYNNKVAMNEREHFDIRKLDDLQIEFVDNYLLFMLLMAMPTSA